MKRIIICADGTWNKPDQRDSGEKRKHRSHNTWLRKPSNVVKLARAIRPVTADGNTPQIVFYDAGVGTGWGIVDPILGGAFGQGLSKNVIDCYRFLVTNWAEGDEIYLFGFSRGAYTVRSLAGLIERIGLLPKENAYWLPEAYSLYRLPILTDEEIEKRLPKRLPKSLRNSMRLRKQRERDENRQAVEEYRVKNKVREVTIRFIGAWDTVGALGLPFSGPVGWLVNRRYGFHNVRLGDHVENAYHALAIDERRVHFKPTLWQKEATPGQTIRQTWFAGVHTNIGGGYNRDGLANCAFQWMVNRAEMDGTGIEFDEDFAKNYGVNPRGKMRDSMGLLYRIFGIHDRPIGTGVNGYESIHWSVKGRYQKAPDEDSGGKYRPKELLKYLRREKLEDEWNG